MTDIEQTLERISQLPDDSVVVAFDNRGHSECDTFDLKSIAKLAEEAIELRKAVEHYGDPENWTDDADVYRQNVYTPYKNGFDIAAELLASLNQNEEDKNDE